MSEFLFLSLKSKDRFLVQPVRKLSTNLKFTFFMIMIVNYSIRFVLDKRRINDKKKSWNFVMDCVNVKNKHRKKTKEWKCLFYWCLKTAIENYCVHLPMKCAMIRDINCWCMNVRVCSVASLPLPFYNHNNFLTLYNFYKIGLCNDTIHNLFWSFEWWKL